MITGDAQRHPHWLSVCLDSKVEVSGGTQALIPTWGEELQPTGCGRTHHGPAQRCPRDIPSQVSSLQNGGCRLRRDTGPLDVALAGFAGRAGPAARSPRGSGGNARDDPPTPRPGMWGSGRAVSTVLWASHPGEQKEPSKGQEPEATLWARPRACPIQAAPTPLGPGACWFCALHLTPLS